MHTMVFGNNDDVNDEHDDLDSRDEAAFSTCRRYVGALGQGWWGAKIQSRGWRCSRHSPLGADWNVAQECGGLCVLGGQGS